MPSVNFTMRAAALTLSTLLGACSTVDVHYADGHHERMSKSEFKAYAEQVFRRQNHVVDRLISAEGGGDGRGPDGDARLMRAEDAMEDACRPLIDLVSATAERRRLELAEKMEMPRAAPACDSAVRAVEALLPTPPTF